MLDFLLHWYMAGTTGRLFEDGSMFGYGCVYPAWGCTP
jgi:hypothetical protein